MDSLLYAAIIFCFFNPLMTVDQLALLKNSFKCFYLALVLHTCFDLLLWNERSLSNTVSTRLVVFLFRISVSGETVHWRLMRSSWKKTFPSWYFSETSVLKYLWSSPHFRGFWTYQKQKPYLEFPGFKHLTWWWKLQKGYWPNFWKPSSDHGFPHFFTWFGERDACRRGRLTSALLSRPAPFPPQPQSWVTLAVPVLFQEFWSFTNTTWVTAQWKVPGTSRLVAVQLSQQPPARPWSSTSPVCGKPWGWSPTTRGKWHTVADPVYRYSLWGFGYGFFVNILLEIFWNAPQLLQQEEMCLWSTNPLVGCVYSFW